MGKAGTSMVSDPSRDSFWTSLDNIRRQAVEFYSALYSSEYKDDEELLNSFLPQVSEDSNLLVGGPLHLQQLTTALQSMTAGKTPGIDGLPVEFYKCFWTVLGEDLLAGLYESLTEGHLPFSCRRTIVTLQSKKGE